MAALALALGFGATSVTAQDRYLMGRVIDAESQAPLNGAFVTFEGGRPGTWTNPDGVFRLGGAEETEWRRVHIELIGYGIGMLSAELLSDSVPINIPLAADPVLLEGFEIVSDRFKRRRNASTMSVRTFDTRQLQMAPSMDMLQFVETRTFIRERPCRNINSFQGTCALVRGRIQPIIVCIDETPMLGGMYMLASMRPDDLSLLEVYSGGRLIRAYTKAFMEAASRRRFRPQPLDYAC